jgi:hypothetical protein
MDEKESASAYGTMFSSVSEDLSRLLPGPAVPGFQKVKDMMPVLVKRKLFMYMCYLRLLIILPFVGICLEFQNIVHRVSV